MTRMETEIGKVIAAGAGRARVEVSPSGMCGKCEMASTCIPAASGERIIEVADPIGVQVDQKVKIELASGKVVLASFLAYIPPIIGMFAGAFIGFYAARSGSTELWGGIGAIIGLAIGLFVSRQIGQASPTQRKLTPVITGVVSENE